VKFKFQLLRNQFLGSTSEFEW